MLREITYEDGTVEYAELALNCAEDFGRKNKACRVVDVQGIGSFYMIKLDEIWYYYSSKYTRSAYKIYWSDTGQRLSPESVDIAHIATKLKERFPKYSKDFQTPHGKISLIKGSNTQTSLVA